MPSLREVMTKDPITLEPSTTIVEAAKAMRDSDVGNVLVVQGNSIRGVVTDRDIAVRAVAEGLDPNSTKIEQIVTGQVHTLTPDDEVGDAIKLMKDKAIRRVPIVENDKPVGIVSIGDLAERFDPSSGLADISKAPPNN